jgi:hypothetical protein
MVEAEDSGADDGNSTLLSSRGDKKFKLSSANNRVSSLRIGDVNGIDIDAE